MEKVKKMPIRKCSGCGEHFPKGELVRVLRTPEGEVLLDLTGKCSGRGAYICKRLDCLRKARKARRIENALMCSVSEEVYSRMEALLSAE